MFIFSEEDYIYDWTSCLVPDRLYFGPFPNQLMMNRLLSQGFNLIVNLTHSFEEELYRIIPSPPGFPRRDIKYIHYPIEDNNGASSALSYCEFITDLKYHFLEGRKIYLHCRGGHGRSSMVSVSLFYTIFPYEFHHAISYVNESHNNRVNLRNKWKKRRSPFNAIQYHFLAKIHKNIYVNISPEKNKHYYWLFYNDPIFTSHNGAYKVYRSVYELQNDDLASSQKFEVLRSFLKNKFNTHGILGRGQDVFGVFGEYRKKLYLTYLKKFVLADCTDPSLKEMYNQVVISIREDEMKG
jgi:hypothetical protein